MLPRLAFVRKEGLVADLRKAFGQRLKAARKASGLTQEELGRAIRIDYKHLGAIERGAKAPSFELVEKIAQALKVEPYTLFLPSDSRRVDVDGHLKAVASDMTKGQRLKLQNFLQTTLRVIKAIDAR
jgi:transcriptional regulator with XRE-family HTH domain